jgi:hypothetical protein
MISRGHCGTIGGIMFTSLLMNIHLLRGTGKEVISERCTQIKKSL